MEPAKRFPHRAGLPSGRGRRGQGDPCLAATLLQLAACGLLAAACWLGQGQPWMQSLKEAYLPLLTARQEELSLAELGEEDLRRLLDVKRADNLAQAPACRAMQGEIDKAERILNQLLEENACVSLRQLAVNGRDLLALGLSGPAVGAALQKLLDAVLEETLPNERAALLAAVRDDREREEKQPC